MSTSSSSSSRTFLTLQELADLPDTPRWYAEINTAEQEVVFYMSSHQLPTACSDGEWRPHGIGKFKVWWDKTEGEFKRKKAVASREELVMPRDPDVLKDELEATLEKKFEAYEQTRYLKLADKSEVPKPVKQRLHDKFGRFYNFLAASKDEIMSVEGMGPTRFEAIQTVDDAEKKSALKRAFPEWSVFGRCPICTAEWRQPIATTDQTLTAAQTEVYCPECDHEDIPVEYLAGPVNFDP